MGIERERLQRAVILCIYGIYMTEQDDGMGTFTAQEGAGILTPGSVANERIKTDRGIAMLQPIFLQQAQRFARYLYLPLSGTDAADIDQARGMGFHLSVPII